MRLRTTAPAIGLAMAAIAAGASSALSQSTAVQSPRLQAYLSATQDELLGTGHDVDSVVEALTISGLEVYRLEGPDTQCLLTAAATQEDGHSQQLACVRDEQLQRNSKPLTTTIVPAGKPGSRIDLVALPADASQVELQDDDQSRRSLSLVTGKGAAAISGRNERATTTLAWTSEGARHQVSVGPDPVLPETARR